VLKLVDAIQDVKVVVEASVVRVAVAVVTRVVDTDRE
jgi:hypothetical protein